MFSFRKMLEMPAAGEALPGRQAPIPTAKQHFVNGHALKGPYPDGLATAIPDWYWLLSIWPDEINRCIGSTSGYRDLAAIAREREIGHAIGQLP